MLETAIILSILLVVGFGILFIKLPVWAKRFLIKRYLLCDLIACGFAFSALGFTLTGTIAAALVSIWVSLALYYTNKKGFYNKASVTGQPK